MPRYRRAKHFTIPPLLVHTISLGDEVLPPHRRLAGGFFIKIVLSQPHSKPKEKRFVKKASPIK